MAESKKMMKDHENEIRKLRAELREKTRSLILERDALKKELKKCNKEMNQRNSTNNLMKEYDELNRKYMNCEEELKVLKAVRKNIVPFEQQMVVRPSFLSDISSFNKETSLKRDASRRLKNEIEPLPI